MRPAAVTPPRPLPRARLGWSAGALAAAFAGLAVWAHGADGASSFDDLVPRLLRRGLGLSAAHTRSVAQEVVPLGAPLVALLVAVGLAVVAYRRRDRLAIALCMVGPLSAMAAAHLLAKPLIGRYKGDALTFPSGHVTAATAVGVLVVVLLYRWYGHNAALRWAPAVALVPVCVSLGVVRLSWHWATDAIGGLLLGAAVVLGVAAALPEAGDGGTAAGPASPPETVASRT